MFASLDSQGIPTNAVLISAFVTVLCVLLNYAFPEKAFCLLMMLVVAAIVINWVVISWTHLKFRKMMPAQRVTSKFPISLTHSAIIYVSFLCLAFWW